MLLEKGDGGIDTGESKYACKAISAFDSIKLALFFLGDYFLSVLEMRISPFFKLALLMQAILFLCKRL
jgi:hypothetical protein